MNKTTNGRKAHAKRCDGRVYHASIGRHVVEQWRKRIHGGVSCEQAVAEIRAALEVSLHRGTDAEGIQHWKAGMSCPWGCVRFSLTSGPRPSIVMVRPEVDGWP